jgi:hypothetical protein
MNIKPYDTRVQQLFQSGYYKIPRFQRPYSWDKGNIEDFWTDVVVSDTRGHFIGSMVFYIGSSPQDVFVVDGQQRLTTITIFLAALRDTFTDVGETSLAKGIQGFIERQDLDAQNRFTLLTETSYPYFQENIQKHGAAELELTPSEEEKGIQSAYDFARKGFAEIVEATRASASGPQAQKRAIKKRLESLRGALLLLNVIVIQLDKEDDAYLVFETLNTRGKDLEPKDLIKNLLSKLLPAKSADVDQTKLKWNKVIQSISESAANLDASTYLHHHWLSHHDYTPERTLFDRVKAHLKKSNAAAFLNAIVADVEIYRWIFEPENFSWSKEEEALKRSLVALSIFKVRQPTPLVLAVLRTYKANQISLKQARETLAAIERFHFMYTAVAGQSSSGGVSKMYAAAARDLSSAPDAQKRAKHLQDFKAKLLKRLPDEQTFSAGFAELSYSQSDSRDRPLIRYILGKLDADQRNDVSIDYSKMTIEHIAPQNPPAGSPVVSRTGSIGNLILVAEGLNGTLKNKPFKEKRDIMIQAGIPVGPHIKNATSWGDSEIDARTKAMAERIHKNAM